MLRQLPILFCLLLPAGCTDLANLFAKPPERCPGDPVAVCDAAVVACYLGPHCKKGPFEFAPNCTRLCRLVRAECEARCFPLGQQGIQSRQDEPPKAAHTLAATTASASHQSGH